MSNSFTTCDLDLTLEDLYSNCQDQCNVHEYAVACGSVGPGPIPEPENCRALPPNPGGQTIYCCPCLQ